MEPADLRAIVEHLRGLVTVAGGTGETVVVDFPNPGEAELVAAGLDRNGVRRLLSAPWWGEMVTEVVETPEFCEPGDSPEQVLTYARDVISEYVAKRFSS